MINLIQNETLCSTLTKFKPLEPFDKKVIPQGTLEQFFILIS